MPNYAARVIIKLNVTENKLLQNKKHMGKTIPCGTVLPFAAVLVVFLFVLFKELGDIYAVDLHALYLAVIDLNI